MVSGKGKPIITLDRFLVQRQRQQPEASGQLTRVLMQLGVVSKILSSHVKRSTLEGLKGLTGETNIQGEAVKKLDKLGNDAFVDAFEYVGIVGAIVSEEMDKPMLLHSDEDIEKYVVLIDPIDGSSNLEVDCVIGSIFSVRQLGDSLEESVFQKGAKQTAAGYIMYGTSVCMVYSSGNGVHSFVLDEEIGEFVLDHEEIRMPDRGKIVSANFGNRNRWTEPPRTFQTCLLPEKNINIPCATPADLHQILHHGGIYFYPEDDKRPKGKLRLLYECAPLAMIAEQAGGGCTTGRHRVLGIQPEALHQRIPFAIGSLYEIGKYEEAYK